ncbi:CDP-glycerol glycerophosphotransferase family protein [uncultured Friedmanniella sp.]|uniref:CDP-glycerol glycerophosphotransferase family protein n=1 Tax=uncultured Friedmanniella sp. TaxID=335381 RepID=UPI0035CB3644
MPSSPETTSTAQRVVETAVDTVVAILALTGTWLVLTGRGSGLALLAAAAAGVALHLRERRPTASRWQPLGVAPVLRGLTIAGAAVALVVRQDSAGSGGIVVGILAAAIVGGSLVAEEYIGRSARFRVPVVSGLPGTESPPPPNRDLGPLAVLASVAATLAGVALAWARASPWWWVALAVVAVLPIVAMGWNGRAKIVYARRLRRDLPQAVAAYAPEIVLYTSRPDDASYQVRMWLPYLERSGLRILIVARNQVPAAALAEVTDLPVVEARRMSDLESLVVPSLRAAFYVNASSGNGAFVRFQHLTHVYLGHGDSDKPPSYNPTHAMYDQVFAAGPAAIRRYAAHGVTIPLDKFRIVGRPQVEGVRPAQRAVADVTDPVVLYAPTWRGHVEETMFYSLPRGEQIVAGLLERGATVMFRPHPFNYDFADDTAVIRRIQGLLEADARRSGRAHVWGPAAETERDVFDCVNDSDAMVSDVSAVVSDYLFSGKPFAMVAVPAEPVAFTAEFPIAAASYVVRGDLSNLGEQLTQMLGADPRAAERLALRSDYLGDFPADAYADGFVDAVRRVARQDRSDLTGEEQAEAEEPVPPGQDHESGVGPETDGGGEVAGRTRPGLGRYWSVVRRIGLHLAGTAIAFVTLAAALLPAPVWLAALLGLLAIASALTSAGPSLRRASRRSRLLAEGDGTRAVLLVALTVLLVRTGAESQRALLAVLGVGVALAAERRVRSAWGSFGLIAVNLPSAVRSVRQPFSRGWLTLASFLVLAFALVAVWVGATGGWRPAAIATAFSAVAAVLVVLFLEVLERSLRRAARATTGEQRLPVALHEHAPEFAVYFASTVGAGYQIGMWLPYFVRIGRPFVIITRTVPMLRQIARLCEEQGVVVPIVYRPTLRSLEQVIVPSMTTAFYVNNAVRNTHFIERRELTHVWLNHGDSEKPACYNPVHAIYDLIFAAGQAGIDRYARHGVDIPRPKFRVVGRPQVEQIEPARGPVAEQQPPTVLYAPTWQGPYADTRVYSLPLGQQIVQALLDRGVRVVFRAHPFNYRYPDSRELIARIGAMLDGDRWRTGREHLWGDAAERELTVEDCFNLSDAMVSDVSAVVSDYLHSGKPFAMVSVGRTREELVVQAPAARAAYVLDEDLSNLSEVLDDLLVTDPLVATRDATRVYYLGEFDHDRYAEGFLDEARRVIGSPPQQLLPDLSASVAAGATTDADNSHSGER